MKVHEEVGACGHVVQDTDPVLPGGAPVLPAGTKTLILTDWSRLAADYGDMTALKTKVNQLAGASGVTGVVVDVGTGSVVHTLNTQADDPQNRGCAYAKNLVAEAIKHIVQKYPTPTRPQVRRPHRRRPVDPVLPLRRHRGPRARVRATCRRCWRDVDLAGEPAVEQRALAGRVRRVDRAPPSRVASSRSRPGRSAGSSRRRPRSRRCSSVPRPERRRSCRRRRRRWSPATTSWPSGADAVETDLSAGLGAGARTTR